MSSNICELFSEGLGDSGSEWNPSVNITFANIKSQSLLKKFLSLRCETSFVLQIECSEVLHDHGRARRVALALPLRVGALVDAIKCADEKGSERYFVPIALDADPTAAVAEVRPDPRRHVGLVDSFAPIVIVEFGLLMRDLMHVPLLIVSILAPWRFLKLMFCLVEPKKRWPARVALRVVQTLNYTDAAFESYKMKLLPFVNTLGKGIGGEYDNSGTRELGTPVSAAGLPHQSYNAKKLDLELSNSVRRRFKEIDSTELFWYEATTKRLRTLGLSLAGKGGGDNEPDLDTFGADIEDYLDAQDGALTFEATRCHLLIALWRGELDELQHASLTEHCLSAAASHSQRATDIRALLSAKAARAWSSAEQDLTEPSKWGPWHKDGSRCLSLVQAFALLAVQDAGLTLVYLVVIASVYRTLPLVVDLWVAGGRTPFDHASKMVVLDHLRGLGNDASSIAEIILGLVFQIITIVSIPGFLEELPRCQTLKDIIDAQSRHLEKGWIYLCQLLRLGLLWKTYRLVLTAVVYSALLPPACLAEAMRPFVDAVCGTGLSKNDDVFDFGNDSVAREIQRPLLPSGEIERANGIHSGASATRAAADTGSPTVKGRFWVGFLVWFILVALSVLGSSGGLAAGAGPAFVPVAGAVGILVPAFGGVLLLSSGGRALPPRDFRSGHCRVTWPNILALVSIFFEAAQLSALVLFTAWRLPSGTTSGEGSVEGGSVEADLPLCLRKPVWYLSLAGGGGASEMATRAAWGLALAWLVAVALPLAAPADESGRHGPLRPGPVPHQAFAARGREHEELRARMRLDEQLEDEGAFEAAVRGHSTAAGSLRRSSAAPPYADGEGGCSGESNGEEAGGGLGAVPLFRHAIAFLGGFCFVSLVILLRPAAGPVDHSTSGSLSPHGRAVTAASFLFYLLTTQASHSS